MAAFCELLWPDPQPERRWLRRGWRGKHKEICWNLNNIRLRGMQLGAIVNRDLSRRIRPVNGITAHKQVVRSDIRISAKVTLHLDTKVGLWLDEEDQKDKPQQASPNQCEIFAAMEFFSRCGLAATLMRP
ncbi:hypothetical protein NQ317_003895 [Molorchus minor]|uniref:Uncharacterized protein n=1 Tax=Molorchus minor TaxID=1323400 RepID=A0ABQ9IT11_9CUCU|nr:hypothetical protein NQ317_003895 [Molorchus minor]